MIKLELVQLPWFDIDEFSQDNNFKQCFLSQENNANNLWIADALVVCLLIVLLRITDYERTLQTELGKHTATVHSTPSFSKT